VLLGRSRLEEIPEASHLLNLEQPEAVNNAMLTFLDEMYQGTRS
jgi:pimeloyl-ACP methyl ester carboxylesterase